MARARRISMALVALFVLAFAFAWVPTQALAKTGWVKQSNGKWRYYATDDYYYQDDIYQIDGKFYGFDANGNMRTGWYEDTWDDGYSSWLYFGSDGAARTGWQKIGGTWYYFENGKNSDGYSYLPVMYSDGVWPIGSKHYAFKKSGAMLSNAWWSEDWGRTVWFYATSDGSLATGWKQIGGTWYYFQTGSGQREDGTTYLYSPIMYSGGPWPIGNDIYFFKASGAMATGWQKEVYEDGYTQWYYLRPSGAAAKGWVNDGRNWYYFHYEGLDGGGWSYYMYSDGLYEIGGKTYYFNKGGDMAVGWKQLGGQWYYFESSGAMATNKWVGNYYLQADGTMATSKWIGNYHVDASGKWDQTR